MLQFFRDLLSNRPDSPGTKRFTAMWCLLLFTIEVLFHLIFVRTIQGEILFATIGLITACLGLNAIITMKDITAKKEVATTVVENNPASENASDAKDILQGKKPEDESGNQG